MAEIRYPRPGTPGASAQRAYESLARQAEAWGVGAAGERVVGRALARCRRTIVLHDRAQPGGGGNFDHIAVAPTGVYVIDTKAHSGIVELVNRGGWLRPDLRLYVAGRDRHDLMASCRRQAALVRSVVSGSGVRDGQVTVVPVLCFVGAEWRIVSARADIDGVLVTHPPGLVRLLRRRGAASKAELAAVARHLGQTLPPR